MNPKVDFSNLPQQYSEQIGRQTLSRLMCRVYIEKNKKNTLLLSQVLAYLRTFSTLHQYTRTFVG